MPMTTKMTKQGIRDLNYRGPRRSAEAVAPTPTEPPAGGAQPLPAEDGAPVVAEGARTAVAEGGAP